MPVSANFIRIFERVQPGLREVFSALWDEIVQQRMATKDEFNELKEIVSDISENLKGLAEAQRRTEEREIEKLAKGLESLSREVGELAHMVEYQLEDEAVKALLELLKRDYIEIAPGKYIEVNRW